VNGVCIDMELGDGVCNALEVVRQAEVATDIHCYGVGAACDDFGDATVIVVLYT